MSTDSHAFVYVKSRLRRYYRHCSKIMNYSFLQISWECILGICLSVLPFECMAQRKTEVVDTAIPIEQEATNRVIKRKVAIGRFSNETKYAKGLFYDKENDPMGKQALDILSAKLAASDKFLLIEQSGDLSTMVENAKQDAEAYSAINADYLIIGSITEFGRKTIGKSNGFSSSKSQVVEAGVAIRLVDLSTGLIIYSEEGKGEATTTTKNNLFTSQSAEYDATLSDKAISGAIGQLVENIINKCTDKPWRTYFLSIDEGAMLIAGGRSQGLAPGDEFAIKTKGKKVKNPQTGITIELPGKEVGTIRIIETGGDTPETEYSFVEMVKSPDNLDISNLVIEELK